MVHGGIGSNDTGNNVARGKKYTFNDHEVNIPGVEEVEGGDSKFEKKKDGSCEDVVEPSDDEASKTKPLVDDRVSEEVMREFKLGGKVCPVNSP